MGIGLLKNIESFIPMGIAMATCSTLLFIRQWKVIFNPEKLKELENTYNDERMIFIARKSYSLAFWVSIYAEFSGILATMYFGIDVIPEFLAVLVCVQVIVYVVANIFYSKNTNNHIFIIIYNN